MVPCAQTFKPSGQGRSDVIIAWIIATFGRSLERAAVGPTHPTVTVSIGRPLAGGASDSGRLGRRAEECPQAAWPSRPTLACQQGRGGRLLRLRLLPWIQPIEPRRASAGLASTGPRALAAPSPAAPTGPRRERWPRCPCDALAASMALRASATRPGREVATFFSY